MSREAYVKDGVALGNSRASVGCHRSTLKTIRVLAAVWDCTLAEALDRAVEGSYVAEMGYASAFKEANGASSRA